MVDLSDSSHHPPETAIGSGDEEAMIATLNPNESRSGSALPPVPRFLGCIQIRSLIGKNFLMKRRTPFGTFFEIFSPMLVMLILVAAYTLSEITTEEAQQYVTLNISLPGPWIDLASQGVNLTSDGMPSRRKLRKFSSSPIESLFTSHGRLLLQELGLVHPDTGRRLQTAEGNDIEPPADQYSMLDEVRTLLTSLLASPIPVPTLDQYVTASRFISSFIDDDQLPAILQDSSYGRSWGNLLTLGTLHLSPNSAIVREFHTFLNETYPDVTDSLSIKVHDSEEKAMTYVNGNLSNRTWAVIDMSGFVNDDDVAYKIRMNYTTIPNTNLLINYISIGLDRNYERYYLSGYLTLQRTLNEFAMARLGCNSSSVVNNMWSMPMPTAAYNQNSFFQAVGFLLGLTIAMAYMYPTSRTIKIMVEEKELRLKETLSILGVRPWAHFWSWLLTNLFIFSLIAILVTVALTSQVLKFSNPVYIFLYIGLFSTATVGFCFVVAACCSKAKFAAILGPLALFATLLPRYIFFGSNRYEAIPAKMWASLLPCTAFAFGADIIADFEYAEVGVQNWNANEGDYSFSTSIGFLFIDTILYMFLGWYLELVIPRQYGVARPWYFLVSPSYWKSFVCSCRTQTVESSPGVEIIGAHEQMEDPSNYEPVTDTSCLPRVVIDDLVKRYNNKANVPPAVDHLHLTLYESQITCLLGHNGAGKSSTISVLTGLYPPTSGDCYIYGHSIIDSINDARQSMGVCPQHNVLYDGLTVIEHLSFFQSIKGLKPTESDLRVSAEEMGLGDYLSTTSVALSGGNKRKLSLAISLCGNPRFLLLDEPTSGMDVASRRKCWELLRRKREGRVTLLTTHFLDEASLLADRIAIMKEGRLQCCGSEMFLKNRFGLGYNLTIVLADFTLPASAPSSSSVDEVDVLEGGRLSPTSVVPSSSSSAARITEFLNRYAPNTILIRTSARELTFRFPRGSEGIFPELFDALEEERPRLRIGAYGITDTTLEEIFLQLAETEIPGDHVEKTQVNAILLNTIDEEANGKVPDDRASGNAPSVEMTESNVDGPSDPSVVEASRVDLRPLSPIRQVALLYRKRFVIQRRDLKGFFFQIILPTVVCALVLLVLTIDVPLAGPPIEMSMALFQSGIDGQGAQTDVVVGGGASFDTVDQSRNLSSMEEQFRSFSDTMSKTYPKSRFVNLLSSISSTEVSQHLLDTYNKHDHNARYGSFVLRDTVNMTVMIDWVEVNKSLSQLGSFAAPSSYEMLDVGSLLDITGLLSGANLSLGTLDFLGSLGMLQQSSSFVMRFNPDVSILHNSSSPHSVSAFNQAYVEYLFKQCTGDEKTARLVSVNHPLPLTSQQTIEIKTILSILSSLFLLIPYCYIPGAFIVFVVKERASKSKHLQLVSGVDLTSYWISSYLWDVSLFSILTLFIMCVFLMYGRESAVVFVGDSESFAATMLLTFGYGLSVLPFSYLLSRPFDNHSSAQIAVMGITFVCGFVAVNAYFILSSIESTKDLAEVLRPLFRWWPPYNVGEGFIQLASAYWEREALGSEKYPLDWDVTGRTLAIIYGLTIPYFLLLLLLEYSDDGGAGGFMGRILRSVRSSFTNRLLRWYGVRKGTDGVSLLLDDGLDEGRQVDDDVAAEQAFVEKNVIDLKGTASVLLLNIWKVFPPSVGFFGRSFGWIRRACSMIFCCKCLRKSHTVAIEGNENDKSNRPKRAVRGVSTAIMEGETYGLLGVNGAGKTTILGVLTGDIAPTGGQAYVAGHDITGATPGGVAAARKNIGFCPQVDPLLDLMSGRETLRMFGRLRGIPKDRLEATLEILLDQLALTPHADKVSESYSGGNKRKLSLGIALIGDPRVLFIDEASSGMDPSTRRKTWGLIEKAAESRSVLLTSHSMEEVEALCSRVGIMVDGKFLCLGSVQHLKSKYLDGYTIEVHCDSGTSDSELQDIETNILTYTLPGSTLAERHGHFMRFNVSSVSTVGLGTTFRKLQELMQTTSVSKYSISQCSLEQVFIKLVNSARAARIASDENPQERSDFSLLLLEEGISEGGRTVDNEVQRNGTSGSGIKIEGGDDVPMLALSCEDSLSPENPHGTPEDNGGVDEDDPESTRSSEQALPPETL